MKFSIRVFLSLSHFSLSLSIFSFCVRVCVHFLKILSCVCIFLGTQMVFHCQCWHLEWNLSIWHTFWPCPPPPPPIRIVNRKIFSIVRFRWMYLNGSISALGFFSSWRKQSKYYTHRVLILFSFQYRFSFIYAHVFCLSIRFSNHQVSFSLFSISLGNLDNTWF